MPNAPKRISVRGCVVFTQGGRPWNKDIKLNTTGGGTLHWVVSGNGHPLLIWTGADGRETSRLEVMWDGLWQVGNNAEHMRMLNSASAATLGRPLGKVPPPRRRTVIVRRVAGPGGL